MSYAVVVAKVDPKTKKEAQVTAEKLGLSLSAVIKGFLRQFIRTKSVTFSVGEEDIPSPRLIKAMKQAEKNWKEGKGSPMFDNAKDAIAYLDKLGI